MDKQKEGEGPSVDTAAAAKTSKKEGKKQKEKPKDLVIPPKKPKLTKAERRALQEAQRAAKAAGGGGKQQQKKQQQQQQQGGGGASDGNKPAGSSSQVSATNKATNEEEKKSSENDDQYDANQHDFVDDDVNKFTSFSHLPPYRDYKKYPDIFSGPTLCNDSDLQHRHLHQAVRTLGLQYASGQIQGGNNRCRAMLLCFNKVLADYEPPKDVRDVRHHIDSHVLKPSFAFWSEYCRPHSVSMGNAFTFVKSVVTSFKRDMPVDQMVSTLQETINDYISERIEFAGKVISDYASTKIVTNDVILTYGHSELIENLLISEATSKDKQFHVIVVDSRPLLEGKTLLNKLRNIPNIVCTYILLNSLSYIMKDVTKVLLGGEALMSDGSVLSGVGTGCVALLAKSFHKPVLVCCETYKMSNRVQLESITSNELGDPSQVMDLSTAITNKEQEQYYEQQEDGNNGNNSSSATTTKKIPNLRLLNLMYDLTPSNMVSGIITEMGILPPTSIAVLLREMNPTAAGL